MILDLGVKATMERMSLYMEEDQVNDSIIGGPFPDESMHSDNYLFDESGQNVVLLIKGLDSHLLNYLYQLDAKLNSEQNEDEDEDEEETNR